MTDTLRLYARDSYLREFDATVLAVHESGVLLDRTAFYPTAGGQEHDTGWLSDSPVSAVEQTDDGILHHVAQRFSPGDAVHGRIDWPRRFGLMQHHTGQHLLSAVAADLFGWETVSVHMSTQSATVEFAAVDIADTDWRRLEEAANQAIWRNLPIRVTEEDADSVQGLRKATTRTGVIRVVEIDGLDRSACGGTHVAATGEIGCILLGKAEKIRKNTRVEFACGTRAVERASSQQSQLLAAARVLNASPDDLPDLVARQREELVQLGKQNAILQRELAERQGREAAAVFNNAPVDYAVRWLEKPLTDADRAFAAAFCEHFGGLLLTASRQDPAFLLTCSPSSGRNAMEWFQQHLKPQGAKGGGSPQQVSGRLASTAEVQPLLQALHFVPIQG